MGNAHPSAPQGGSDESTMRAHALLTAAKEELTRADGKASLLLAAVGVAAGALLSALLSRNWSPSTLSNGIEWLWWLGASSWVLAIGSLGHAVYPRTVRKGPAPRFVGYFGDVVRLKSTEEVNAGVIRSAEAGIDYEIDQLGQISRIVATKYQSIRLGLWLLVLAFASCTVSLLVDHVTS